jgi:hypothetical protein
VHTLGLTQFPIEEVSVTVFPAANRQDREADYSHFSTIEVTYGWSYAFTSTCLHDAHTGKFAFFLLSYLNTC